jgi:tyrosinase
MSRSRREFLKAAGAGSLALASVPFLELLEGSLKEAIAAGPFVRLNVKGMTDTTKTIISYKAGIKAMQALPASNPLNWTNWANIHGSPSGTGPLWNTCQHGSWWFFPWHRMYLFYLEAAIRQFSGDATFALPYWDYTDPTQRALPVTFRSPTTNNPLFVSQRGPGINAGNQLPPSVVTYTAAFNFTNFASPAGSGASFGGQSIAAPAHLTGPHGALESLPHDQVHGAIGGWMGQVNLAARDPIFWLHHANIDRLWSLWLTTGGGRRDPSNTTWCNQVFRFFNTAGVQVPKAVKEVLNTLAQLNYSYQGAPAEVPQSCPAGAPSNLPAAMDVAKATLASEGTVHSLGRTPLRMKVNVPKAAHQRALAAAQDQTKHVMLRIEGITFDKHPDLVYEVYIGLPATSTPAAPTEEWVGNISTFGAEHAGDKGHTVELPISAALAKAIQKSGDAIDVTIVPRGTLSPDGKALEAKPAGTVKFKTVRIVEE